MQRPQKNVAIGFAPGEHIPEDRAHRLRPAIPPLLEAHHAPQATTRHRHSLDEPRDREDEAADGVVALDEAEGGGIVAAEVVTEGRV